MITRESSKEGLQKIYKPHWYVNFMCLSLYVFIQEEDL